MTLGQRIQDRLKELGKNQAWLCTKVAGLEIGTLNALVVRKSKNSKFALQIAKELNVSLEWLVTGQDQKITNQKEALSNGSQDLALSDWPFDQISKKSYQSLQEWQRAGIQDIAIKFIRETNRWLEDAGNDKEKNDAHHKKMAR